MVKKIKDNLDKRRERGGGERVPPRTRGGLALFLSLIILIVSFPFSVSAATSYSVSSVTLQDVYSPDFASRIPIEERYNLPFSFSRSSIDKLEGARITFSIDGDFDKNEVATFQWNSNFNYSDLYGSAILYSSTDLTNSGVGSASIDGNSFTIPVDCSHIEISLYIYCDEGYTPHTFKLDSLSLTVASESSGLLNSILEWLQNIRDKIVGLPDAIGSFITSLSDNIKALFADLKNWFDSLGESLREWFQSVGDWFSQLGENIKQRFQEVGQWFTDIGDRISGFFSDLWQKVLDFFLPPEDFWKQINEDLDAELTESLGFIYEVPKLMLTLLTFVFNGVIDGTGDYTFTFPAIEIMGYKLTDSVYYDWEESISVLPSGILGIYEVVITLIWIVCTAKIVLNIAGKLGLNFGDEIEN